MGKLSEALEKAGLGGNAVTPSEPQEIDAAPERGADLKPDTQALEVSTEGRQADEKANSSADTNKPKKTSPATENWDKRLFKAVNEDHLLPEIFKTLRARILHPGNGEKVPRTIMVTSTAPKEGKSFVAANLGISLASGMDQHALLVDCDLRKPTLAKMFGIKNDLGLVDYLRGDEQLGNLLSGTGVNCLSILPSGKPPVNPSELLSSAKMADLVGELSERYDDRFIIIDSPPLLVAAESAVLAGKVDAVILVIRQRGAVKAQVERVLESIEKDRLLGVVFNDQVASIAQTTFMKKYSNYSYYMSGDKT